MQDRFYRTEAQNAPPELSEEHRRILEDGSAIDPEVIAERGVRTVRRPADLPSGYSERQRRRAPGMLFTVHRPNGEKATIFRPDKPYPDNPGWKYEQMPKSGGGNALDVHPWCRQWIGDRSVPLMITEGCKKADSLVSAFRRAGVPVVVVAVSGVWNWVENGCKPIADLYDLPLQGRSVTVSFDSDVLEKWQVQLAAKRLAEHCEERGASVYMTFFPSKPDGSKCGADDHFAGGGTLAALRLLTRRYDPSDFELIRIGRDERLRAGIEDLYRRMWDETWKAQGGASDRDVFVVLIEAAKKYGRVLDDGIRVEMARGPLALAAKLSTRTVEKAIHRLEDRSLLYRDNTNRKADKSGAFVLRANVSHNRTKSTAPNNRTSSSLVSYASDLHLRAPRLRWSQPKYTPRRGLVEDTRKVRQSPKPESRPAIKRLGKIRGSIIDALDAAGGTLTLRQIADVLHRKRPRDIRRRNLPMLEDAGIVEVHGDTVSLTANWIEALEEQRRLGKEIEAEEIARTRYEIKRDAYREYIAGRNKSKRKKTRGPSEASVEAIQHSHDARDVALAEESARPQPKGDLPDLTEEQARIVRQRVREGMKQEFAIESVVARTMKPTPEPGPERKPASKSEPERKLPKKVGGIYRHDGECHCWLCEDGERAAS